MANTNEPTRPIGQPTPAPDGTLRAKTTLSPKECRVRARLDVPPSKVMPIIVVPGIMGSNLRASTTTGAQVNQELKPGEQAWRPPNTTVEGIKEADKWKSRLPATRQKILDGATLEVDPTGAIKLSSDSVVYGLSVEMARERGWGEVHWDSYGVLLTELHRQSSCFIYCENRVEPAIAANWLKLNKYDRSVWGGMSKDLAPFNLSDVESLGAYWYPVYAFGYNWLQSNEQSAKSLADRIEKIIQEWTSHGFDCKRVVLVTHSMGGLVARACARRINQKISAVVHVCMPTLGAPVCYRRIACGTETSNPNNGRVDDIKAAKSADIAGVTAADTNPVMGYAPGPLELLPNNRYPQPWLHVSARESVNSEEVSYPLWGSSIYELYSNTSVWYRLFQPEYLDPAGVKRGKHLKRMTESVRQAERFHEAVLGEYFHPNTYALYGVDPAQLSYGSFKWRYSAITKAKHTQLASAELKEVMPNGNRCVKIGDALPEMCTPSYQNQSGDGTVPSTSAAGCNGGVLKAFGLKGFGHQEVFSNEAARTLTFHLVARGILNGAQA